MTPSKHPLVSIIVPTRNSSTTLDACLKSIKNQSYKNIELIVVDRDSTDGTKKVAKKYTKHVLNHGPERCAQRNFGARKAAGKYLAMIDSDMELNPKVIEACVEKITETSTDPQSPSFPRRRESSKTGNSSSAALRPPYTLTADRYTPIMEVVIPEESFGQGFWAQCKRLERSFYVGVPWIEAARFFEKSAYDAAGGYDETMVSGEDWDLSRRVEAYGGIANINEFIRHNEGHIKLWKTLKKKYYYAQHAKAFLAQNKDGNNLTAQKGPIQRYKLFLFHPTKLMKNPILGISMLFMKTAEFAAGGLGMLRTREVARSDEVNADKNLKIGVMIDRIIVGGVEKIAIEEVAAFRKAGYDATLLVLSRSYPDPKAFKDQLKDIPIIHLEDRLPKLLHFSFKFPFFNFFSFFHLTYPIYLPFVVKKKEFDFIVSHNPYTSFTALSLLKIRKIPYIYYLNDHISYIISTVYQKSNKKIIFAPILPISKWTDKRLLNNASSVLVSGDDHAAALRSMMKNPDKLAFITPGHEIAESIPKKRGDYFLLASAWKDGKKIENLFATLKPSDNVKFKIAGKWIHPEYRNKVLAQIKSSGLEKNVEIVGEVTESKLNKLFRNARASIIYSNEKGFGMASVEAASNGCTFIIPENCGAARYFRNKVDGLFYKFGDDKQFFNSLFKLNKDDKYALKLGNNAWEYVKNRYSWDTHIYTIMETLNPEYATRNINISEKTA